MDEALLNQLEENFEECHSCKSKIDFSFYRIIVLRDKLRNPLILRFHYFFPCWDIELFTTKFQDYELIDAGISCELELNEKNPKLRNLRENADLWT